jgi:hypothetical protein
MPHPNNQSALESLDQIASNLEELSGELDNLLLLSSETEGLSTYINRFANREI